MPELTPNTVSLAPMAPRTVLCVTMMPCPGPTRYPVPISFALSRKKTLKQSMINGKPWWHLPDVDGIVKSGASFREHLLLNLFQNITF